MKEVKFAERLRELRLEKNLKQTDVSKAMNVSGAAISRWELGKDEPDYKTLVNLAIFLKVTADYLLGLED